jgi:hypothetical protein
MAKTCLVANAGARRAMPKTIEIRPSERLARLDQDASLHAESRLDR